MADAMGGGPGHGNAQDVVMSERAEPTNNFEFPQQLAQDILQWKEETLHLIEATAEHNLHHHNGLEDVLDNEEENVDVEGVHKLQALLHFQRMTEEEVIPTVDRLIEELDTPGNQLPIGSFAEDGGDYDRVGRRTHNPWGSESDESESATSNDDDESEEEDEDLDMAQDGNGETANLAERARRIRESRNAELNQFPEGGLVIFYGEACPIPVQPEFLSHARNNPAGLSATMLAVSMQLILEQVIKGSERIVRTIDEGRQPVDFCSGIYKYAIALASVNNMRWTMERIRLVIEFAITVNTSQCIGNVKSFTLHGQKQMAKAYIAKGCLTAASIREMTCPVNFKDLLLSFRSAMDKELSKVHRHAKKIEENILIHKHWQKAFKILTGPRYNDQNPDYAYQVYLRNHVDRIQLAPTVRVEDLTRPQRIALKLTWHIALTLNPSFGARQATLRNPLAKIAGRTLAYSALCRAMGPGLFPLLYTRMTDEVVCTLLDPEFSLVVGRALCRFPHVVQAAKLVEKNIWNNVVYNQESPRMPNFDQELTFLRFKLQEEGTSLVETFMAPNDDGEGIDEEWVRAVAMAPDVLASINRVRINNRFAGLAEPDCTVEEHIPPGATRDQILQADLVTLEDDEYFTTQRLTLARLDTEPQTTINFELSLVRFSDQSGVQDDPVRGDHQLEANGVGAEAIVGQVEANGGAPNVGMNELNLGD